MFNGVNLGAYSDDEKKGDVKHALNSIREDDYKNIAALGFNIVRLNLWHRAFRESGGWKWLELHRLWARRYGRVVPA